MPFPVSVFVKYLLKNLSFFVKSCKLELKKKRGVIFCQAPKKKQREYSSLPVTMVMFLLFILPPAVY